MNKYISQISKTKITSFCHRWHISQLALFGSILRDDFKPDSDVDVLITSDDAADWGLFDHVKMQQELQTIFQRQIDLITMSALEHSQNWLRRNEILKTTQIIYHKKDAIYGTG